jgi:hypothetical protein
MSKGGNNIVKLFEGPCEQVLKAALEDVDEIETIVTVYKTKDGDFVGIWDGNKALESLGLAAYIANLIPSAVYER